MAAATGDADELPIEPDRHCEFCGMIATNDIVTQDGKEIKLCDSCFRASQTGREQQ
jgi:ribosome-binding protein aMBF1 (putative translation factor)